MSYKINKYNTIKHKFDVISNILNPTKRAKSKNSHYSTILQGLVTLELSWTEKPVQQFLWVSLCQNLNKKMNKYVGKPIREVHDL